MRKIEQQMVAAVRRALAAEKIGFVWKSGNTRVESHVLGRVSVYLFGNLIAIVAADELAFQLGGWATPTTRSRINALCREFRPTAGVFQQGGKQYAYTAHTLADVIGPRDWVVARDFAKEAT